MSRIKAFIVRWTGGRSSALQPIGAIVSTAEEEAARRGQISSRFESLGENCELGFVQEHHGTNPLGLFRWSGITLDDLVTALETSLDGIGDPEFTRVEVNTDIGEYFVRDVRYGMTTHTMLYQHQHSADDVLKTFCTRGKRLREKLLDDLQEARKIFVFQTGGPVPEAELQRLHQSLRRIGPSAELLYVRPAADEVVGSVERVKPGLLAGYIDRAGFDGTSWTISYDLWLDMMDNAVRIVDARS